jgi:hypothetical protein
MAVGYINAGARSAGVGTSRAPAKPSVTATQYGGLLAVVTSKNNAVHACADPAWVKVDQQNSGASFTASLWIAAASAAAPTFTWAGSVASSAQIFNYSAGEGPIDVAAGASLSVTTGATNPHTSSAIVSTREGSLAVYVDVVAVNSGAPAPAGWDEKIDSGSATDGGAHHVGDKAFATLGGSSGAISISAGAAAWVQWQVEMRVTYATQLEASKFEALAWVEILEGVGVAKAEALAWLDPATNDYSKLEALAWLEPGTYDTSKLEALAWLEAGVTPPSGRRMSLM